MGEIRPLARLGELPTPKHLVNCTQYYASTPTIKLFQTDLIMDQSTNKTTNEWLLEVGYGKTCPTLGALLFAWQQNHSVGCTKSKDRYTVRRSCLFRSSVLATICPHKNPPNFRHFDDIVLNLRIHSKPNVFLFFCFYISFFLSVFFFASFFFYYYLSIFLHLTKTVLCRKRLRFIVSLCFVVYVSTFVHSLGWGNFRHPNTLWTALNTTHQPLQLNFFKLTS